MKRTIANSGWTKADAAFMRACSDCFEYAAVRSMVTKSDGRVICPKCQRTIDILAKERAQENLFVTQPALF